MSIPWDRVAAGWEKWWRVIEPAGQGVTQRMLDRAEVRPGLRVLDIATGVGEPALSAASRVGPAGRVLATDLSSQMLAIARERAGSLTNVEFMEADVERMDFPESSFDAVLWRWGVTDLSNPQPTLLAIRRWLSPRGAFATAVWDAGPNGRPMASIALTVAQEMFALPAAKPEPPPPPGSTSAALQKALIQAGFTDVMLEEMTVSLELPAAQDCAQYLTDVSPTFLELLSVQSSAQQAEFRRRLARELRPYADSDGVVRIPNLTICAVGRK